MKINQEQIDMVLSAVMAMAWSIKPDKGGMPLNFFQYVGKLTECIDEITPEFLMEALKEPT